jgi:chaperone LolA
MKKVTIGFLAIAAFLTLSVHLAPAQNAKEIIKNVKKKYDQLQSLKADFEQEYVWELAGETQKLKGALYLKTGNLYRIETDNQIIVTNGQTVWTFSKDHQQVIIDHLRATEENPLPKDLLFKYSEEYTPHLVGEEMVEGKRAFVLNLVPKDKEAFVKSMKIWVDAASWLTIKIEQKDINDNLNKYWVRNVEENIKLAADFFNFQIPGGVEVVDLR